MNDLASVNDWRVALGSHLGSTLIVLIVVGAVIAVALSAVSLLWERRRARALGLLALRTAGIGMCLVVALQPSLELGQITRVPNYVPVLVDASRSMTVTPPDGGSARYQRAAALQLQDERQVTLGALQRQGVMTLDVPANQLSIAVINRYLELKARTRL